MSRTILAAALNLNPNPRNGQPYFNTAAFTENALGTPGTAKRRFFYGPGMDNFDMALLKNVRLTESKSLQFRIEAFNVFNHAQFFGPQAVDGNIEQLHVRQGHQRDRAPPGPAGLQVLVLTPAFDVPGAGVPPALLPFSFKPQVAVLPPGSLRQYFLLQYFVEPACDAGDVAMVF